MRAADIWGPEKRVSGEGEARPLFDHPRSICAQHQTGEHLELLPYKQHIESLLSSNTLDRGADTYLSHICFDDQRHKTQISPGPCVFNPEW